MWIYFKVVEWFHSLKLSPWSRVINYKIVDCNCLQVEVEVLLSSEVASMFIYPPSWMWRHLVMLYLILKTAQNGSFWMSDIFKVLSMKSWKVVHQTVLFYSYWCCISWDKYLEYNLELFYKISSGSANFLCHGATVCPIFVISCEQLTDLYILIAVRFSTCCHHCWNVLRTRSLSSWAS